MFLKGQINFLRVPSVKTLTEVFGENARKARAYLKGELDPDENENVAEWIRHCWHEPPWIDKVMEVLNELAETFGVEAIFRESDDSWPTFLYLNTGDTYAPTLIFNCEKLTIYVSSWGDVVERNNL